MNTENFSISEVLIASLKGLAASLLFSVIAIIGLSLFFTTLKDPGELLTVVPPIVLILSAAVGGFVIGLDKNNALISALIFATFQLLLILITGILLPSFGSPYNTIAKCGIYLALILSSILFSYLSHSYKHTKKKRNPRRKRRASR